MFGLYRSSTDVIIFGICAGIAERLEVRASVVRIAFALLGLASGIGILLYLLLALIVPVEGNPSRNPVEVFQANIEEMVATFSIRRKSLGIVLVVAGALLFLVQLGFFDWLTWTRAVPILLICIGIALFLKSD
jgi:phage shock protein C